MLRLHHKRRAAMTLCPIALAVGCAKCPAFSICPLKTTLGDQPPAGSQKPKKPGSDKPKS
jgi:hypothetical protein